MRCPECGCQNHYECGCLERFGQTQLFRAQAFDPISFPDQVERWLSSAEGLEAARQVADSG